MRDGIDFGRSVARFGETDVAYIVDVLRGAYSIAVATDEGNEMTLVLGDFIEALDECDSIEIVEDEMLVDEN